MDSESFSKGADQRLSNYAVFADGKPVGFWHEAIHGPKLLPRMVHVESDDWRVSPAVAWEFVPNPDCAIPAEAVKISDAEWRAFMEAQAAEQLAAAAAASAAEAETAATLASAATGKVRSSAEAAARAAEDNAKQLAEDAAVAAVVAAEAFAAVTAEASSQIPPTPPPTPTPTPTPKQPPKPIETDQ